ncbi:MAG TPA: amidohydrolase [Cyclobacteriaceae bacterium]|nr:amidohydrolase [Cyclobacteriaceae bacterium]
MKSLIWRSLLLFGILSCTAPPKADLIFTHGKIWSGKDSATFDEAMAIRGNRIVAVGSAEAIAAYRGTETKTIDLGGKLMVPGFNDAHIHFLGGSMGLLDVDLNDVSSISELVGRIKKFAADHPARKWITGRGWQYTMFPGGLPVKEYLDTAIQVPVFVRAYDGHSAWANSAALRAAGIDRNTVFDGFGEVVKDKKGEPTGVFKEHAMGLMDAKIPQPTREEQLSALRLGMQRALSLGITSIANASGDEDELKLYQELLQKNELAIRVAACFSVGEATTQADIERYKALKDSIGNNRFLTAGQVKFMLDGVIESHTAAMLRPYDDVKPGEASPAGSLTLSVERYQQLVQDFDRNGFQIFTHAIGDRAVREALNAYEVALKTSGSGARHRIEHIETIAPVDIPRFSQLGVLPSMEPIHAEPGTVEVWANAIGKERLPNSFAWAAQLKAGNHLVFSSDWPACVNMNPIRGLHTAVNRKTIEGLPEGGWVPEQRLTIIDALSAYTEGGAYSSGEEADKGRLAAGYLADLVVLSEDLFSIEPMKTYQTRVLITVVDGKIVYEARP